jgi:hypothetical protein
MARRSSFCHRDRLDRRVRLDAQEVRSDRRVRFRWTEDRQHQRSRSDTKGATVVNVSSSGLK